MNFMRKIKQLIAVCLSLALVCGMLCALPVTVSAAESGTCGDNLTWSLDDNGTLTISGTGDMWDFNYNTRPWRDYCDRITAVQINDGVTSIGGSAFSECWSLMSVTIPDGVTSIGNGAFQMCWSLMSVTIPDSVTSIGWYAFDGGPVTIHGYNGSYAQIYAGENGIPFYNISDGTLSVAGGRCGDNLTWSLDDKGTLKISGTGDMWSYDWGNSAWRDYAYSITAVQINDGVTSIGYSAFMDCGMLTGITIPDSVTSIGECAFQMCGALESITIPDGVTSIGVCAFLGCSMLTSITIPDSVTYIGDSAFSDCRSLASIAIPDGVTSIEGYAFSGCSMLTSITIPDSVTYIGWGAFSYCSSLASIAIPDGVTSIGGSAFEGCSMLTDITIPNSVTYIGWEAFYGCPDLTIHGYDGSYAQTYAQENNIAFDCLVSYVLGDVNGDGKVNGDDVSDLSRYVAGWPEAALESVLAADVNGDGKINGDDVSDLSRFVAGWPDATLSA